MYLVICLLHFDPPLCIKSDLVRVSMVIKKKAKTKNHRPEEKLFGRTGFISVQSSGPTWSWEQPGQETGGSSWCRVLGVCRLLVCFSWHVQPAAVLYPTTTTCPEVATPTVGWAFPHQSLIKKVYYRFAYRQILWGHFLNQGSLFPSKSTVLSWQ